MVRQFKRQREIPKQPRKVRKQLYNFPLHLRRKLLTAPVSDEIKEKYGIKRIPVRKGDTVLIVRGQYAGVEDKVIRVDLKKVRIYVKGVTRKRVDGTEVHVPIHPSKVVITKLDLSDPLRKAVIERKAGATGG